MIINKNKVRRERNVFRNKLVDDSQPNDTDEPITAIYFDGRKDQTFVHLEDTNLFTKLDGNTTGKDYFSGA